MTRFHQLISSGLEKAIADALADSEKSTIKEALDEAAAEVEERSKWADIGAQMTRYASAESTVL